MARTYGNVLCEIWRDRSFRQLPAAAQRVFMLLHTQPDITAAGVLAVVTQRWADMSPDTDVAEFEDAIGELASAGFVVVDWRTQELLVVPFVRWDGGHTNPKRRPVIERAAREVASPAIGWALAEEFKPLGLDVEGLPDTAPDSQPDSVSDTQADTVSPPHGVVVVTEVSTGSNPQPTTHTPRRSAPDASPDFERFWSEYPRKVDKGHARKAWAAAMRARADPERIIASAAAFAGHCRTARTEPKFIPHPSTWINGERYHDQPDDPPTTRPPYWTEATTP